MAVKMKCRKALKDAILNNSHADTFEKAVYEWDVTGCRNGYADCICGQPGLCVLFTIKNAKTGKVLHPIGSDCIKKFGRSDLSDQADIFRRLYTLADELYKNNGRVPAGFDFSTDFFSRKFLEFLFEEGAFPDSRYNGWDGSRDYEFCVEAFNGKYHNFAQRSKENALLYQIAKWIMDYTKDACVMGIGIKPEGEDAKDAANWYPQGQDIPANAWHPGMA